MADAKTIQRLPVGLLDLLGMQSTGDAPHLVSGEVQPVLDLTDLYLTDRLRGANGATANVAAIGGLLTTVGPPAGQQWMVYGVAGTMSGALAAATGFTGTLLINRPSVGFAQFVGPTFAVANPAQWVGGQWFERPLIMRPGDTLGIWISAVTGAPAQSVGLSAIFVPLTI